MTVGVLGRHCQEICFLPFQLLHGQVNDPKLQSCLSSAKQLFKGNFSKYEKVPSVPDVELVQYLIVKHKNVTYNCYENMINITCLFYQSQCDVTLVSQHPPCPFSLHIDGASCM